MTDLDQQAKALYERCAPVAPRWEQLGETTKDTWREQIADPTGYRAARKAALRHAVHAAQSELAYRKTHKEHT